MTDEVQSTRMTDIRPDEVLIEGEHYRVTYRDVIDTGETRAFIGHFVRYVPEEDLCIFYDDNSVHRPRTIAWSSEMVSIEKVSPNGQQG